MNDAAHTPPRPTSNATRDLVAPVPRPATPARLAAAVTAGLLLLVPLAWLLARLVWLWFFFGLFFYLMATLLAGALVFRVLRPARPMRKGRIALVCAAIAGLTWLANLYWEYRFIAETAGAPPAFATARTALFRADRDPQEVRHLAAEAFRRRLAQDYWPGGAIGYARWAVASGEMSFTLANLGVGEGSFTDAVRIEHRRTGWVLRAIVALGLLFLGMWWQLVDLHSAVPTSNLIDPDEADEIEREEKREYGEPGYTLFDHTADVGLEARARDWPGLLEQAAYGLIACIGKLAPDERAAPEKVTVALAAPSREELLRDWLAELLFLVETRGATITRIDLRETAEPRPSDAAGEHRLRADVLLQPIDRDKSVFLREVKAVTYHGLSIEPIKRGLSARVILDI